MNAIETSIRRLPAVTTTLFCHDPIRLTVFRVIAGFALLVGGVTNTSHPCAAQDFVNEVRPILEKDRKSTRLNSSHT